MLFELLRGYFGSSGRMRTVCDWFIRDEERRSSGGPFIAKVIPGAVALGYLKSFRWRESVALSVLLSALILDELFAGCPNRYEAGCRTVCEAERSVPSPSFPPILEESDPHKSAGKLKLHSLGRAGRESAPAQVNG
jgi:hypothetical protein